MSCEGKGGREAARERIEAELAPPRAVRWLERVLFVLLLVGIPGVFAYLIVLAISEGGLTVLLIPYLAVGAIWWVVAWLGGPDV